MLVACFQCCGQSGEILVANPLIRQGDSFDLVIEFPTNENDGSNRKFLTGSLKVSSEEMSIGKHKVGPILVAIDGKTYSTNSVLINISSQLPNVREGLWVSISEEYQYIILEQRMPVGVTVEKNSKSSVTIGTEAKELVFTDFDVDAFISAGILVSLSSSVSAIGYTNARDRSTGYSYKTTVYSYKKLEPLTGPLPITARFYKNLPKGMDLTVIEIK